jgi:hypothetical protein
MAAPRAQGGGEADAVKALELERFKAQETNDFPALERLLADDLVYTHSSGAVDSKASYIESLRSGKARYLKIVPDELKARVVGDTVLIHGRGVFTLEAMVNGQKGENVLKLSFLDVWQKRGGKWQMIAWQSARLPQS